MISYLLSLFFVGTNIYLHGIKMILYNVKMQILIHLSFQNTLAYYVLFQQGSYYFDDLFI